MAKKPDHIHKYKKVNLATTPGKEYLVYKCLQPLCSHYIPLHLAEGKACECNRCGDVMIITRNTLVQSGGNPMALPHCESCIKRKNPDNVNAIADFLEKAKSV
jgi:hypothetical protein